MGKQAQNARSNDEEWNDVFAMWFPHSYCMCKGETQYKGSDVNNNQLFLLNSLTQIFVSYSYLDKYQTEAWGPIDH